MVRFILGGIGSIGLAMALLSGWLLVQPTPTTCKAAQEQYANEIASGASVWWAAQGMNDYQLASKDWTCRAAR